MVVVVVTFFLFSGKIVIPWRLQQLVNGLECWPRRTKLGGLVDTFDPVEKLVDNSLGARLRIENLREVPPFAFDELLLFPADLNPVKYWQACIRDVHPIF